MLRISGSGGHEKDGSSLVSHAEYRRAVEASGDPQGALFYFNLQMLSKMPRSLSTVTMTSVTDDTYGRSKISLTLFPNTE